MVVIYAQGELVTSCQRNYKAAKWEVFHNLLSPNKGMLIIFYTVKNYTIKVAKYVYFDSSPPERTSANKSSGVPNMSLNGDGSGAIV